MNLKYVGARNLTRIILAFFIQVVAPRVQYGFYEGVPKIAEGLRLTKPEYVWSFNDNETILSFTSKGIA